MKDPSKMINMRADMAHLEKIENDIGGLIIAIGAGG